MSNTDHDYHQSKSTHTGAATRNLSLLFCLGALAGILIWAKLRLVTDIPRSAYADPREQQLADDLVDDASLDESAHDELELDREDDSSDEPRETHP